MTKQEQFFETYAPYVQKVQGNIFSSVTLAQMALETGYAEHIFHNNCFGIKGTGQPNEFWDGMVAKGDTTEYFSKDKVSNIKDYFRVYDSFEQSIRDHNRLLEISPRYAPVRNATTPEDQCQQLQACGYATAIKYSLILIQIINKYNLKRFDVQRIPTSRQEA